MKIIYKLFAIFIFAATLNCNGSADKKSDYQEDKKTLLTAAEQPEEYLPLLKDKKIGMVVNHTSLIGEKHLVDYLQEQQVNIKLIFAPEHGFRGNASDGKEIKDGIDQQTGIAIASLYGKNRKPSKEQLKGLDLVLFDIQDVGCRFYTYISTMHYVMEACAENNIPVLILDRPNPNGDYIAGPVRAEGLQSFVGMHPIPVVHGLTIGELAKMIKGEQWINRSEALDLTVISVANYRKSMQYVLPVKPSPNLPNQQSVRLYPSLCFFEATSVSVGRGTDFPFQVLGGTNANLGKFTFTPRSIPGASINPPNKGKKCYGIDLRDVSPPQFTLQYFLSFYHQYKNEQDFVISKNRLEKLSGSYTLLKQIRAGKNEAEIIASWEKQLANYKKMRKPYLIYPLK